MRFFRPCLLSGFIYPEAIFRVMTGEKTLYLTFDDGPDPESTPVILGILARYKVRAIFFCQGETSERYPVLIKEIKRQQHIIGNHGYTHYDGWKTSVRDYCENVDAAAGVTSEKHFRPPHGHLRLNQYRKLKKKYRIIFWDIMPYDFDPDFGPDRSLNLLKNKIRPGSVIVLHDSPLSSCKYFLEEFLESSINRGFRFDVGI